MFNTKEKKERSLGVKLFLKPNRCSSAKCAMVRRASQPGMRKAKHRRGAASEFKQQLTEKQKIKYIYGLRENQLKRFFKIASRDKAETGPAFLRLLERRLDNVVFRAGFAQSRSIARQLTGHGHFLVNHRRVTIPSCFVDTGDVITIREGSKNVAQFKDLLISLKHFNAPNWLDVDKEKLEIKVLNLPQDIDHSFDLGKIIDFYSR